MTVLPHPDSRRHTEFQPETPFAWMDLMACGTGDPDAFFPNRGGRGTTDAAKAVCADCPVVGECLAWAVVQPERLHGVFGGLTERERRAYRTKGAA